MDRNIEKYLDNVHLPKYENSHHRQELRRELIKEMERRRQMASRRKVLKVVYILAALVCASAIAITGATYRKWIFKGEEDGIYTFTTEPEKVQKNGEDGYNMSAYTVRSNDPNFTMSPSEIEQTQRDLEEMDALRQQNKRELVRVIKTELGEECHRHHTYKYILSDGREHKVGESAPGERRSKEMLALDIGEIFTLRKEGKGELLDPEEEEIEGKVFVFERYRIKLSDGNEVIHSIGGPK